MNPREIQLLLLVVRKDRLIHPETHQHPDEPCLRYRVVESSIHVLYAVIWAFVGGNIVLDNSDLNFTEM